jgi:hypothetical protein
VGLDWFGLWCLTPFSTTFQLSLLTLDQDVIIFLVSVARGVCRMQGLVLTLWPNQYVTVL